MIMHLHHNSVGLLEVESDAFRKSLRRGTRNPATKARTQIQQRRQTTRLKVKSRSTEARVAGTRVCRIQFVCLSAAVEEQYHVMNRRLVARLYLNRVDEPVLRQIW